MILSDLRFLLLILSLKLLAGSVDYQVIRIYIQCNIKALFYQIL